MMMKQPVRALLYAVILAIASVWPASPTAAGSVLPDSFLLPEIKTDHPAISGVDIVIDVGHGGIDGGTSHGSILEKNINLAIAQKTYEALRRNGYLVLMNRMNDYALSGENLWLRSRSRHIKDLAQRSHLANEVNPKLLISLHVNSARNANTRGALLLHQKNEQSKSLAAALQSRLNELYGISNDAVYGRTYYLLKHTNAPAVIVEMGFLTNASDRAFLTSAAGQQAIADKIAEGVVAYLKSAEQPN
ncbi:N-acetylmuramoyl-L-alanine amidase [Paenibacillus validus]|uniref:N-acetylmuramoyl-L-alanine amidase n=2 Tax=Paenibacillus TaxID=44249 RepID=A0A7X2Z7M6_9BACL|nr:N-acetylmuramoyl-L-alanine amidase [Paenibacillus validus]